MEEKNFINQLEIDNLFTTSQSVSPNELDAILKKAEELKGLTYTEVVKLLNIDDEEGLVKIFRVAKKLKEVIYGNRVVIFAPLYISNYCVNNCTYCGYKRDNKFERKKLALHEIREEVRILEKNGHKRLALEVGEDPRNSNIDYVLNAIDEIYAAGDIRRINVNIAATTTENYRRLKEKELGTYILFQETYNKEIYKKLHPKSLKGNYTRQLYAHHKAMDAGIDDVGGGVLFGLAPYKQEVLSLILHNQELESSKGVGFHTISVPRLKEAEGVSLKDYPHLINDFEFKKVVSVLRLALPYTGIILSTRESVEMRQDLISHGITQVSAGSCTTVAGYKNEDYKNVSEGKNKEILQFELADERTPLEVIKDLVKLKYLPSYCTACYRTNRTGEGFMKIVKAGKIGDICKPNALMTFVEYIEDYGDEELNKIGFEFVENELKTIKNNKLKEKVVKYINRVKQGERDLYI
jgi:2-iminoacetate synthase